MLDLDALVLQAGKLPPLPASAAKLAALVASAEPDMHAVAAIVEHDPAFAVALLRRANSAAAGANRNISTVREAVTRLGVSVVLTVVTSLCARPTVDRPIPEYGLAEGELWAHARAAAIATELIGRVSLVKLPAESSTTALLHDIGKIVLARFLEEEVRTLLDRAFEQLLSYRRAELAVLGITQSELGGFLAERWSLPTSIVQGIMHHHAPAEYACTLGSNEDTLTICHAVYLANFLAKCNAAQARSQSGHRAENERTSSTATLDDGVLASMRYLGVDATAFASVLTQLRAATAEAA